MGLRHHSIARLKEKTKVICSAIRGQPQRGLRCFISTTAWTSSVLGPGPACDCDWVRTACGIFACTWLGEGLAGLRASAQGQSGADEWDAARTPASRQGSGDSAPVPGAIQDQELMLEQKRLGNDGTGTARSEHASQGSDEMDEKDDQIAHHRIPAGRGIPTNYGIMGEITIRQPQLCRLPDAQDSDLRLNRLRPGNPHPLPAAQRVVQSPKASGAT
jgi:hypothetical protein